MRLAMASPIPRPDPRDPASWLRAYAKVQQTTDAQILAVLRKATTDITRMIREISRRPGVGALVRVAQLTHIKRELLAEQVRIYTRLGDIISRTQVEAALAAIRLGNTLDEVLLRGAGAPEIAKALLSAETFGLRQTVDLAVVRMTQSRFPLAQRIYNSRVAANGRLDRMISSAILRGLSPREFAREARDWFSPDTPGGLRYASMRLARTELNNAFHAAAVNSADKPWITGMRWYLSRSHPKADDCDALATEDSFRLGAGVFPVRDVPRKPHPQCFCYVVPEDIGEEAFLDNLIGGKYDSFLKEKNVDINLIPPRAPEPAKKAVRKAAPKKPSPSAPEQSSTSGRSVMPASSPKVQDAKAWTHQITSGIDGGKTRDEVVAELERQSTIAPSSVRALRVVNGSAFGNYQAEWLSMSNPEAFAYYHPRFRSLNISPAAFDSPEMFVKATHRCGVSGWFTPSDSRGVGGIVAHEFGHHIEAIITRGNWQWAEEKAQQFFPSLLRELGVPGSRDSLFSPGGKVFPEKLDFWVRDNSSIIEKMVSRYAATSGRELIAEIWREYSTAPNPRPYIVRLGRILQDIAERSRWP